MKKIDNQANMLKPNDIIAGGLMQKGTVTLMLGNCENHIKNTKLTWEKVEEIKKAVKENGISVVMLDRIDASDEKLTMQCLQAIAVDCNAGVMVTPYGYKPNGYLENYDCPKIWLSLTDKPNILSMKIESRYPEEFLVKINEKTGIPERI